MNTYLARTLSACAFLSAVLVLSACTTKTRTLNVGEADPAAVRAAEARAEAAEAALESLARAQAALGAATTNPEQRTAARTEVDNARKNLEMLEEDLEGQPNSAAKTAVDTALMAVNTALAAVSEVLGATNTALGSGGGGGISFASMHTSLDRAQTALDDAQTKLREARAANPDTALSTLLIQAQAALTTAQISLVPELRRELDTAEAEAAREKERADTAEAERDALRDEHVHPPLFRSTPAPRELGATITITRTARTVPNADGDEWVANPNKLDIATDAVPYAAGTTLASRAGDEFPMRAITFRGDIRQGSQRGRFGADADNQGRFPIVQGPRNTLGNANDHTKTAVVSSIQLSEDGGLILKAGGSGVVFNEFQWDIRGTEGDGPDGIPGDSGATTATTATAFHVAMFRRAGETPPSEGATLTQDQADRLTGWAADNCSGVTFPCWDGNMRDLTIDFGKPSPDPDGESGYHWASLIPSSPDQPKPTAGDAMHRWATGKVGNFVHRDRGAGEYRGEYRVWLSNYAGAESDDSHRYLQYAAYGLFTFTDYLTSNVRPARMQGFHFGYDAFADTAGMRTTDLDTPITARFMGRASGMVMEPHSDRSQVERLIRVRGDLTLNAVIGGANTITGKIINFQTPSGRAWGPYAPLTDGVRLANGTIAADGSYTGDTSVYDDPDIPGEGATHLWDPGAFGGNFYGNRGGSDLETAGWWYLTPRGYTPPQTNPLTGADARDYPGRPDFRYSGAFGSFGAKCTEGCE